MRSPAVVQQSGSADLTAGDDQQERELAGRVRLLLATVWTVVGMLPFLLPFNFDAAWLYYVAERVLEGQRLYVDIIDNNPPLIVWLMVPPVLLSQVLAISPLTAFVSYMLLLVAGSGALAAAVLGRAAPNAPIIKNGFLVVFPVVLIGLVQAGFGEREHLMLVCVIPYLLLAWARRHGARIEVALGLTVGGIAALGLALKPFFLGLPLGIELYLIRSLGFHGAARRPELWALGLVGAAYALLLPILSPEYVSILKLTQQTYGVLDVSWRELLAMPLVIAPLILVLLCSQVPISPRASSLRTILSIAAAALLAGALVQKKGWYYHLYPSVALSVLLATTLLLDLLQQRPPGRKRRIRARSYAVAVVALALLVMAVPLVRLSSAPLREDMLRPWIERYARNGSIAVLGTEIGDAFPAITNARVRLASPVHSLQVLPGFYAASKKIEPAVRPHTPAEQPELERWLYDVVVSRMVAERPELVVVNVSPDQPGFGGSFDYLYYLAQDPRFTELWRDYRLVGRTGMYEFYTRDRLAPKQP